MNFAESVGTISMLIAMAVMALSMIVGFQTWSNGSQTKKFAYFLISSVVVVNIVVFSLAYYAKEKYFPEMEQALNTDLENDRKKEEEVVSVKSIGTVIGGSQTGSSSLFSSPTTSIETDKGIFGLRGSHPVIKGVALEIQLRKSGSEYICEAGTSICTRYFVR